jgi:hypothetical protein
MRRLLALLGTCAAIMGCGGPGNSLSGSISESFSLDFDVVQVRKQDLALIIEYIKNVQGGTNKACKLVVDTSNLAITSNSNIKGDTFLKRVTVSRVAPTGGDFDKMKSGSMHFDDYSFKDGGSMAGTFDAIFDNGRTIHGSFEGRVAETSTE